MKNLSWFTSLAIVSVVTGASAQSISASKVPAAVKASFSKAHPGVKAKWELENGAYEASFKINGLEYADLYSKTGSLEEKEVEIKIAALPATVPGYVKAHYPKETVHGAAKITKTNGDVNYEAAIKGKDLIFDNKGNFIKEAKD